MKVKIQVQVTNLIKHIFQVTKFVQQDFWVLTFSWVTMILKILFCLIKKIKVLKFKN
jgi:hypothetical protein